MTDQDIEMLLAGNPAWLEAETDPKRLFQILWHHLHWQGENGSGFTPQPRHFNGAPFLDQLTRRIYAKRF